VVKDTCGIAQIVLTPPPEVIERVAANNQAPLYGTSNADYHWEPPSLRWTTKSRHPIDLFNPWLLRSSDRRLSEESLDSAPNSRCARPIRLFQTRTTRCDNISRHSSAMVWGIKGETQSSGGRPERLCHLTGSGSELFPRHYSWFAELLIESLREQEADGGRIARTAR
jgi:hypothetical protein